MKVEPLTDCHKGHIFLIVYQQQLSILAAEVGDSPGKVLLLKVGAYVGQQQFQVELVKKNTRASGQLGAFQSNLAGLIGMHELLRRGAFSNTHAEAAFVLFPKMGQGFPAVSQLRFRQYGQIFSGILETVKRQFKTAE